MRRPRFGNSRSSSPNWSIQHDMAAPRSPTQMSVRYRDTGFPEPFCGTRNTSLPHPDAKIGPDAYITEDDINVTRALLRHRMTFKDQAHQHSRFSSLHGRSLSGVSDEGAFSGLDRLATTSIRDGAESRPTTKEDHSIDSFSDSSDGNSSRAPDSPSPGFRENPRDAVRDPRDGKRRRRRSSFFGRLLHR